MTKPKPRTYNAGAEAERKATKAYLRRLIRGAPDRSTLLTVEAVLRWVQGRCDRYRKREGGL